MPCSIQQSHDSRQRDGEFLRIGDIARVDVMAKAQAALPVQHVAQAHLAQIMPALLVVPALRQLVAGVGARHLGVEIRGVIGQQATTDQLLFFPDRQQARLRLIEFVLLSFHARLEAIEAVPELLRVKALGRETPSGNAEWM